MGLICGIIISEYVSFIYIIVICFFLFIAYLLKQHITLILLLSAITGWITGEAHSVTPINDKYLNKEYVFSGIVYSTKSNENIRNIVVDITHISDSISTHSITNTKCIIYIPSLNPIVEFGDRITFWGSINKIKDDRDIPDEFNISQYLGHKNIIYSAFIAPENIINTDIEHSLFWDIRRFRPLISHEITSLPLSSKCIEFLNTTITGDTSMISEEDRIKYSTTGIAHILALSGLHVGIITFIIIIVLFPLDIWGQRKLRFFLTILLLWGYAIMTGLSPSVTRAVIMASIFLTAQIIQRNHNSFNSLCLAAILIITFSPNSIYDIGFQLSFISVSSILLFSNNINPIKRHHRLLYHLGTIISASTAAMLGTGIIIMFYFHNFPIYFLISNIFATILLPIIIIGGVFSIILSFIGIEPSILCFAIDYIYNLIDKIIVFITTLPYAKIDNIYFNVYIFIPYFISIACLYLSLKFKRRSLYILTGISVLFTIIIHYGLKNKYPTTEYFIPQNTYYTNILIRDTTSAYLISTAHGGYKNDAYNNCVFKYNDYFGKRNVDSLIYIRNKYESKRIFYNGEIVVIGDDVIAIIKNNNITPLNINPKYALVCDGFKGNIIDIYRIISPDTILLSNDLHKKRIMRYIDSCKKENIPYISLRDTCFHRIINQ